LAMFQATCRLTPPAPWSPFVQGVEAATGEIY
jgi:hypothetical protein